MPMLNPETTNRGPRARSTDEILDGRHPSVAGVALFVLNVNPNLPAPLAEIAHRFADLAEWLVDHLADGPELTVALRKLLESKDAAVRAAL